MLAWADMRLAFCCILQLRQTCTGLRVQLAEAATGFMRALHRAYLDAFPEETHAEPVMAVQPGLCENPGPSVHEHPGETAL